MIKGLSWTGAAVMAIVGLSPIAVYAGGGGTANQYNGQTVHLNNGGRSGAAAGEAEDDVQTFQAGDFDNSSSGGKNASGQAINKGTAGGSDALQHRPKNNTPININKLNNGVTDPNQMGH